MLVAAIAALATLGGGVAPLVEAGEVVVGIKVDGEPRLLFVAKHIDVGDKPGTYQRPCADADHLKLLGGERLQGCPFPGDGGAGPKNDSRHVVGHNVHLSDVAWDADGDLPENTQVAGWGLAGVSDDHPNAWLLPDPKGPRLFNIDRDVGPKLTSGVFVLASERGLGQSRRLLRLPDRLPRGLKRPPDVHQAGSRKQNLEPSEEGHGLLGRQVIPFQWGGLILGVALVAAALPIAFRFRDPDRGALAGGAVLLSGMLLCLWWLLG